MATWYKPVKIKQMSTTKTVLVAIFSNASFTRTIYPTVPVTVEYEITELGKTLIEPLEVLRRWSEQHKAEVLVAQETFDNNQRTANT